MVCVFCEEVSTFVTLTIDLIDILIEKKTLKFLFSSHHIYFLGCTHSSQKNISTVTVVLAT